MARSRNILEIIKVLLDFPSQSQIFPLENSKKDESMTQGVAYLYKDILRGNLEVI